MDRYRVVRVLATSASSRVSLAESLETTRRVVIKELPFDPLATLDDRHRMFREAQLLAALQHPNILRLLDSFMTTDALVIVTEHCEGGDLHRFVRSHPLAPDAIREIFIQLLLALKHMHDRRILHRDLKLHNVLVATTGKTGGDIVRVKIGDFGIARRLETRQLATTMVGTPYYLSPEVCARRPYDGAVDVWSLGCILYELSCGGRHPFVAANLADLLGRIQTEPVNLHVIRDPETATLLQMMLHKDARQRPSVDELLYQPQVQQWIQHFVAKIGTRQQSQSHPAAIVSPPPSAVAAAAALSSTAELLQTMQPFVSASSVCSLREKLACQLKQAQDCCLDDITDKSLLQSEAMRVQRTLARALVLPSRINRFLAILQESPQTVSTLLARLEELFDAARLAEVVECGLVGDALVRIKIDAHLQSLK